MGLQGGQNRDVRLEGCVTFGQLPAQCGSSDTSKADFLRVTQSAEYASLRYSLDEMAIS